MSWCECPQPDADPARDFGMCKRCYRKPHSECRACPVAEAVAS